MIIQIALDELIIALGIAFIATAAVHLLVPHYLHNLKVLGIATGMRFMLLLSVLQLSTLRNTELQIVDIALLTGVIGLSFLDTVVLLGYRGATTPGQTQVNTGSETTSPLTRFTAEHSLTNTPENDDHDPAEVAEVMHLLQHITVDDVQQLIDFGDEKQTDGMLIAMAHVLRRVGQAVPDHQTWQAIKAEHREGISKAYVSSCKRILKANGLMRSEPYGQKERIVWESPDIITLTILARQIDDAALCTQEEAHV